MLRDDLLVSRYLRHLDRLITLAELEVKRTKGDERINALSVIMVAPLAKSGFGREDDAALCRPV